MGGDGEIGVAYPDAAGTETSLTPAPSTVVLVVNSAYDDPDTVPGDGVCFDGRYIDEKETLTECSLRAAIQEANLVAGVDSVIIRIDLLTVARGATATGVFGYDPAKDLWRIPINTAESGKQGELPAVTRENVHIDGSWQKEGTDVGAFDDAYCAPVGSDTSRIKVMVDGSLLVTTGSGLTLLGEGGSITGLAVSNFPEYGVVVAKGGDSARLNCLHIGTDHLGKAAEGNDLSGVLFDEINGPLEILRSLISGNGENGVLAYGDSLKLRHSRVGVDRLGGYAVSNADTGVVLAGSNGAVEYTHVSGNDFGITIAGTNNSVKGSLIGVNRDVNAALPNTRDGVRVSGSSNHIGGTPTAFSVIAGNGAFGVFLTATSNGNTVANAWIGHNGGIAIPNFYSGVINYGTDNQIGELGGEETSVLDGDPPEFVLSVAKGDDLVVHGTVLSGNTQTGVISQGSLTIVNTYIGTDATGLAAIPNGFYGVYLVSGSPCQIGGSTQQERNVISGNGIHGIHVSAADNVVIEGNFIGVDASGLAALPNGGHGVAVLETAGSMTVGGLVAGERNIVSGNTVSGIRAETSITVLNNFIGTDAAGTSPIPNGDQGIHLDGGSGYHIGGASPAARNVISGNSDNGIFVEDADDTIIEGNYIGLNAQGSAAMPNTGNGIVVSEGASNTLIGGTGIEKANVISGNVGHGVFTASPYTYVAGNYIGTDAAGMAAVGNGMSGVVIVSNPSAFSSGVTSNLISGNTEHGVHFVGTAAVTHYVWDNRIGTDKTGSDPIPNGGSGVVNDSGSLVEIGAGTSFSNTIAFNLGPGVSILNTGVTRVLGNDIFGNGGLGIDIGDDGITPNDNTGPPYDTDTGPNGRQNTPEILRADPIGPYTIDTAWELYSAPNTEYNFDFFVSPVPDPSGAGEGQTYAWSVASSTDSDGFLHVEGNLIDVHFLPGLWLTMTATPNSTGKTSEFSYAFQIPPGPVELASGKVYLEGPFAGGLMSTFLLTGGALPTVQPYTDPLFDGTLQEFDDVVALSTIPANTVDWVTLSLRSSTAPEDEVERRVAFVRNDGVLIDYDGDTDVSFPDVGTGNYYLVVCHRNHLCAMSASAVDFSGGSGTWDFTTGLGQAYDTGGNPMKYLGSGVYGLFAADNNVDGIVTAPDFNLWNAQTTAGAVGYVAGDHNLDGNVTAPDFNLWNANTTAGAASQVPE